MPRTKLENILASVEEETGLKWPEDTCIVVKYWEEPSSDDKIFPKILVSDFSSSMQYTIAIPEETINKNPQLLRMLKIFRENLEFL